MTDNWNNQKSGYGNHSDQGTGQGWSDNNYGSGNNGTGRFHNTGYWGSGNPSGGYGGGQGGAGSYGQGYGGGNNGTWYGGYGGNNWNQGSGAWGQGAGNSGQNLSDQDIQRNLNDALDANPTTSNANINAKVQNKVVTLTGTVRSRNTKRMAGDVAWNQPGVNDVHNNVQVQSRNWLEEAGHAVKEAVT